MTIKLPYGREGLTLELPEEADLLRCAEVPGLGDEHSALVRALREPIGSKPLQQLVKAGDTVVVVHSDITRATPNERLLPVILHELLAAGVKRGDIVMLNGLGTHRPQTRAELRKMLGDEVVDNFRCEQHDCNDDAQLVSLGTTSLGNPVRVNRLLIASDVRILTGFIEPHFFAGFSGGPKAVLPALAGAESVQTNHSFAMIGHPKATWGVTQGNPLWDEICEVALRVKPTFLVNVTMNAQKQITGVFAGEMLAAHRVGCEFVRQSAMLKLDRLYDVAITTNGGYPLDQNLYQAIKGVSAASRVVREGGIIILCAACEDGLPDHGGYAQLLARARSPQKALEMLSQPGFSEPDQWAVQIQAQILLKQQVYVHSEGLTPEQITQALYRPCVDPVSLLADLRRQNPQLRVCVLPEGPQTIGYLAGAEGVF